MIFTLLGGLACLATALGVSMVGLALIDRPRVSWSNRKKSTDLPRFVGSSGPAFQPVDLGPVPLKWPSEQVWPPSRLPALPWPSETWTDDFFKGRQAAHKSPEPAVAPHPAPRDAAPKKRRDESKKKAAPPPAVAPTPAPPPPTRPPPEPSRTSAAQGVVGDAELLAWADEKGLASTVEMLRDRNGWEFQQAAQHLARLMRARREGGG